MLEPASRAPGLPSVCEQILDEYYVADSGTKAALGRSVSLATTWTAVGGRTGVGRRASNEAVGTGVRKRTIAMSPIGARHRRVTAFEVEAALRCAGWTTATADCGDAADSAALRCAHAAHTRSASDSAMLSSHLSHRPRPDSLSDLDDAPASSLATPASPNIPLADPQVAVAAPGPPSSLPAAWSPYAHGIADDYIMQATVTKHAPNFLNYRPGDHAIAGPLPTPPRTITLPATGARPPPRPPRLSSPPPARRRPITQPVAQQDSSSSSSARTSLSAVTADHSDSPCPPSPTTPNDRSILGALHLTPTDNPNGSVRSMHSREGAFPATSIFLEQAALHSPTTLEQLAVRPLDTQASAYSLRRDKSLPKPRAGSDSPEPDRTLREFQTPELGSAEIRVSATKARHFSMELPVRAGRDAFSTPSPTPSRVSMDNARMDTLQNQRFSAVVQPDFRHTVHHPPPVKPRKRAPGVMPESMFFQDVLRLKTAAERARAYTDKLADLMQEPSGLADWISLTRHKPAVRIDNARLSVMSNRTNLPQPRHVSGGSIASEVTFPTRADACLAQDLSPRVDSDMSPPTGLPSLPYPGLAHGVPRRQTTMRQAAIVSPPASLRSVASLSSGKSTGGFFATISRRASIGKKSGSPSAPLAPPNKLLSRREPVAPPQPRPIKIGAVPSIPGGPRAPPSKVPRAQTLGQAEFAARSSGESSPSPQTSLSHSSAVGSSPATGSSPAGSHQSLSPKTYTPLDPFARSLNGMVDLLPHVDREILAVYLRQADGREINAIRAYLEDERLGAVFQRP